MTAYWYNEVIPHLHKNVSENMKNFFKTQLKNYASSF